MFYIFKLENGGEMIIEIDTELVRNLGLNVNEYVFLKLIEKEYPKEANELCNLTNNQLKKLEEKQFIKIESDTIVLRQKFFDIHEKDADQICALLMSVYPKSEYRNGGKVILQKSQKKIEAKIKLICGTDKTKAEHIKTCLERELDNRRKQTKAEYLPDMLVWLNQERWKAWEGEDNGREKESGRITKEL